jgi:flagellar basal-body rod protein FlgB
MPISQIRCFPCCACWHQERQRLLAENVANADTRTKARDLGSPRSRHAAGRGRAMRTSAGHLGRIGADAQFQHDRRGGFEVRPAGNAVNLEGMIKVA